LLALGSFIKWRAYEQKEQSAGPSLDNRTRKALSSYLEERREDGSKRLFLGQRGPLSEAGINYLVTKYAYQARLMDCTSHTLRHTFAKNLVDAGTPLDQVATLLGHESLDTTRVYTCVTFDLPVA